MKPRPIRKLLVANRGEIAVRILSAARELDVETYAVFTENDVSHTYNASHAIRLPSPSSYMDVSQIIQIVQRHDIDAVHPGYGFLSESVELASRISNETQATVIGPGRDILEETADKLQARQLAERCGVPTLPALVNPTDQLGHVREFARETGYPIMIKAVDGGGGRGIRLVSREEDLPSLMARAIEESPSRQVFAEKAAVEGFRHIEVQIIGDFHGNVTHLWERECSIQRRYQKVVEMAPSSIANRELVSRIIESAVRMARQTHYVSLGTFEFLANPRTREFFFLEINPRLQVEHTVTESIALTDLVQIQLRIAQGASIKEAGLRRPNSSISPPALCSLQLRITAEDVAKGWSLSVGKIQSFHFPSGNGVRFDSSLVAGTPAIIGSDFDSLIAKMIVTAPSWDDVLRKAKRALEDTRITGVQTNLHLLQAILTHKDFAAGECDTTWLERNHAALLSASQRISQRQAEKTSSQSLAAFKSAPTTVLAAASASSSSPILFRKGDAWTVSLQSKDQTTTTSSNKHHVEITKISRNDFPRTLAAEVTVMPLSDPSATQNIFSSTSSDSDKPAPYILHLASSTAAATSKLSLSSRKHRQGSSTDPSHVIIPFPGKLVEVCVDVGDKVESGAVICVVRQMKMELEVRCKKGGVVGWVIGCDDDDDDEDEEEDVEVREGILAAIIDDEDAVADGKNDEGNGVDREKAKL